MFSGEQKICQIQIKVEKDHHISWSYHRNLSDFYFISIKAISEFPLSLYKYLKIASYNTEDNKMKEAMEEIE